MNEAVSGEILQLEAQVPHLSICLVSPSDILFDQIISSAVNFSMAKERDC